MLYLFIKYNYYFWNCNFRWCLNNNNNNNNNNKKNNNNNYLITVNIIKIIIKNN